MEKNEAKEFLPLINEFRQRFLFVIIIFLTSFIAGLIFYEKIVRIFLSLLNLKGANIVFSSPFEYMNLAINCGLIISIVTSLPIIVYQIIKFIKPALTESEYHTFKRNIPLSIILFLMGFFVGFQMMKYVGYLSYQTAQKLGIATYLNISNLISVILLTSTLMGVAFQFPLVLIFLIKTKVVNRGFFVTKRPLAYIIAIVFASLMPPTDILSLILLTLPLVFLYEIVLLFTKD